jgi:release factor glutamine methyltransferase
MHTLADAQAWARKELKRARVESSLFTADILIGFVLGWDRARVLSHPEHSLGEDAWQNLRDLVSRRARGEPLHYLTGEREFFGYVFRVTPEVLIPRPETEILVEKALDLARSSFVPKPRFLDIGTGSGCIAVSVACEIPSSLCWAVDLSAAALRVAHENSIRHSVAGRILCIQADLLDCFPRKSCFDFILCNPPYIPLGEYDSLPPEVRDHEPQAALLGGESGLDVYRRLVPEVASRLVPGGYLLLELGAGQAQRVAPMVAEMF